MNVLTILNPMLNHVCWMLSIGVRCQYLTRIVNVWIHMFANLGMLIVMSVKWPPHTSAKVEVFTVS